MTPTNDSSQWPDPQRVGTSDRSSGPHRRDTTEPLDLDELSFQWSRDLDRATDAHERLTLHQSAAASSDLAIDGREGGAVAFVMRWLRRLGEDLRNGAVESPLDTELEAAAQRAVQFALRVESDAIQQLRQEPNLSENPLAFVRHDPRQAGALRDLGRLMGALRGTGVLRNEDSKDVEALISFDESLRQSPAPPSSPVPDHMRVTRDDLLKWADETGGRDLPALIRQLIVETANGLTRVHFPTGSGVSSGGWDGTAEATAAGPYVPEGQSGWELSCEKKSNPKAESDYAKRTNESVIPDRSRITYVQVICRPWQGAASFGPDHRSEGKWKDVWSLNVDDIEAWLGQAPLTTAWLAERLGRPISGVRTSTDWWSDWLQSTKLPLGPEIVLAGREQASADFRERLRCPGTTTIGGDFRLDEVRAFVAATLAGQDDDDAELRVSALFLSDSDDARRLLSQPGQLVILVPGAAMLHDSKAGEGHHVIVPTPGTDRADLVLPPIEPDSARKSLEALGILHRDAVEYGVLARRSLLALRRRLATQASLYRPSWAEGASDVITRRVLLATTWNRSKLGDTEAIGQLMDRPYAEVEEALRVAAAVPEDPIVAVVDERWHVVSPMDSWLMLGTQLTAMDLEALHALAVQVLLEPDPREGMSDTERFQASFDGITARYSKDLLTGVATSLALLGTVDDVVEVGSGGTGGRVATSIVWQLTEAANADATSATWCRLALHLPLLTEAAPEVVIEALRRVLISGHPFARDVFADKERTQLGSPGPSPHTHVLWALESLVWSTEYFDAAVSLMARLADLDPGGEWANRPSASLASVFCPWHPNTSAPVEQRAATLARLRSQHPETSWALLLSMLPNSSTMHTVHQGPKFRDWKSAEPVVTRAEYAQVVQEVGTALLEEAGRDPKRWTALIKVLHNLLPDGRSSAIAQLADLAAAGGFGDATEGVWDATRTFVSHHREYSDAVWALSPQELEGLDAVIEELAPASIQHRFRWLFENTLIELGDVQLRDNFEAHEATVEERRTEAVRTILTAEGFNGLAEFAANCALPGEVGAAVARLDNIDLDAKMAAALESDDAASADLGWGYFTQSFQRRGWEWIDTLLAEELLRTPVGIARLLRATHEPAAAALRADDFGPEVAREFWSNFSYLGLGPDYPDAIAISERLVHAGRPAAALDLLALYCRRNESAAYAGAAAQAFEHLMRNPDDPEIGRLSEYDINGLIKLLAAHRSTLGLDRVIQIEWFFLPLLGFEPKAPSIHRTLAEDPSWFVEMVRRIFRSASEDEVAEARTDSDNSAAMNAHRLLSSWNVCPGTDRNDTIDYDRLREWVADAREALIASGHEVIGDQQIGQALAAAPPDTDGTWPAEPVRQLLEDLQNDQIERGLEIKLMNNRGATSRSLDEGGRQEWDLAEKYRTDAERLEVRWPRSAAIYRRLAGSYEAHARRQDAETERWQRGLDH